MSPVEITLRSEYDDQAGSQPPNQQQDAAPPTKQIHPLRVWPAIALLAVMWVLRVGGSVVGEASLAMMMARFMIPLGCSVLILLWWVLLSRATMRERIFGGVLVIAILIVTAQLADKTIVGFGTLLFAVPWGMSAFAVGAVLLRRHAPARTVMALLCALIGFGYWDLIRTDEIRGNFDTVHNWRWEPSEEEEFIASLASRTPPAARRTRARSEIHGPADDDQGQGEEKAKGRDEEKRQSRPGNPTQPNPPY